MPTSELVGLHDGELLEAILKHYQTGTLPQVMPLHREHIEVVTAKNDE
ncbi:hypothetical protein [Alicyclobacillus fastidiosus]|nr:hypothetical protein [Alicyclobacillus fastidiosus]GMA65956.1 hypothetical protein GCM10025859_63980 [Alicyclobacillus fastidiosus]GMA66176.1 hypothetical protein GCM10025859_66180 [Alicyclobacillus fastidiosus]